MTRLQRAAGAVTAALLVSVAGACSTNSLGNVLGGVLGGGQQEMSGTVQGVDTRSQQIFLQQSNGQTIGIGYDSRTQVVYQNQTYSVNSLERGDELDERAPPHGTEPSASPVALADVTEWAPDPLLPVERRTYGTRS